MMTLDCYRASIDFPDDKSFNFVALSLSPPTEVVDVGRLGLICKYFDDDPYFATTVYQHGVALAIVSMGNSNTFNDGLLKDSEEKLRCIFRTTEGFARNIQQYLPGLDELRKAQWAEAKYHRALWNIKHTADWDVRPVTPPVGVEPSVVSLAVKYSAAAAYLTAERYAGGSKARVPVGLKAMRRLVNGEEFQHVLAEMERELMRSGTESKEFPGRYLKYGPADLEPPVLHSHQLAPKLEVTIHESAPYRLGLLGNFHEDLLGKRPALDPYYLALFHRDGVVVLAEHIIGEYEPWLSQTSRDSAFVAHVLQI